MAYLTLLDQLALSNDDRIIGLIEDVTTMAPEASQIPIIVRPGTTYRAASRTALPTAGFRAVNAGLTPAKSSYKQTIKEMFYADVPLTVDEALVKADGGELGDILSLEAQGGLQGQLINIGSQTYYGAANDGSNGFVGLRAQMVNTASAAGTTGSTTAYFLWCQPQGVHFDVGDKGAIAMAPWTKQQITAPSGTGVITAYVSNISFWIGLSVGSDKSVYGVTGITNHLTTGKLDQAMTDQLAAQLVSNIPVARRNGIKVFMNRLASYTLQASRTAINYQPANSAGTPAFAPAPTVVEGYPIVLTDSITNTENNT